METLHGIDGLRKLPQGAIISVGNFDGIHLGQEDLSVKDVRVVVGTRTLIGVSTHNVEQARAAVLR